MARIAILGGTGPEGLGLALRWAQAAEAVAIGSRDARRAAEAVGKIRAVVPQARVIGGTNDDVIPDADFVALCFPFDGAEEFVTARADLLAGKIVVDVTNPLSVRKGVFGLKPVADGSSSEMIQRVAPKARVVGAFKNISAEHLQHLDIPLEGDVLLCGDDAEAKRAVEVLVRALPRLRPLDGGGLVNNRVVEGITALLLNLNKRYKAVTEIRIIGIDSP